MLAWRDVRRDGGPRRAERRARRCRSSRPALRGAADSGRASCPALELDRSDVPFAQARRAPRSALYFAVAVRRGRSSTRACSPPHQVEPILPGPARRALRQRDRPGALALLDQHVPVVAARPAPSACIAHNGEINTVRGQPQLDARPRRRMLASRQAPRRPRPRCFPVCTRRVRATPAPFDEVLELAAPVGGRSLPHAVLMMVPEAWENPHRDGPAPAGLLRVPLLADGAVGRPGVRSRSPTAPSSAPCSTATACARRGIWVTADGSSSWRPRPGCSTSTPAHDRRARAGCSPAGCSSSTRPGPDHRGRRDQGASSPRAARTASGCTPRAGVPRRSCPSAPAASATHEALVSAPAAPSATPRRSCGSCSAPMAGDGRSSRSAPWAPTRPSRCCASRPRLLFDYFTQLFAQVTNPPLDAIREELVTSPRRGDRPRGQPARPEARCTSRLLVLPFPVIDNDELAKIPHINDERDLPEAHLRAVIRSALPGVGRRPGAPDRGCEEIGAPRRRGRSPRGARIIVLSDRGSSEAAAPIPALLLTGAVHHHLIQERHPHADRPGHGDRRGPRGATTWRCLIGYGAGAR